MTYTHTHTHTRAHTRMHTHIFTCACIQVYVCVCIHIHTCFLVFAPVHSHIYHYTYAPRHYSCARPYTPCTYPDCSPSQRPRDRHHHRHIFRSPPTPPSPAISFLAKPSVLTEVMKPQGTQMLNTGHLGTTGSSTLSRPCYVTSELSMICFMLSLIYVSHSLQHASCTMQSAYLNFILTTNLQGR